MCSREGLLDLENEKYVVSVSYVGRAQLLSAPAITVILKCPLEAKSSYLPCSCCYFYLEV